jgi:deoxyribodipyrimidine photolyase-like uncharacterized protein
MPAYVEQNVFGHTRSLPGWFWNGRTRMRCLAHAIGQSLEQAYAHHIQRLMVIGNFALLAGLDPVAVHRWYLGVYVDAFEWVELPNTVGMNQFANGGLFIAHHARFNYGFNKSECQRLWKSVRADVLCTVRLSRKPFPAHPKRNLR